MVGALRCENSNGLLKGGKGGGWGGEEGDGRRQVQRIWRVAGRGGRLDKAGGTASDVDRSRADEVWWGGGLRSGGEDGRADGEDVSPPPSAQRRRRNPFLLRSGGEEEDGRADGEDDLPDLGFPPAPSPKSRSRSGNKELPPPRAVGEEDEN